MPIPDSANYQKATSDTKACAVCSQYMNGTCDLWNAPVGAGMTCDSFSPAKTFALDDVSALATVDIDSVPILAAGGPYHGKGSPAKGDFFTEDYLNELAANNTALAGEVKPANKIGHSKAQRLLVNSGLATDDDERPAAGWLQNFRVEKDDAGGAKLLADIKGIPASFAKLLKSNAFRTRSVEISKVTAQSGDGKGKKLSVISGLAWLGAKAPAVRTLDDIAALYSGTGDELLAMLSADEEVDDDGVVATIDYSEADVETAVEVDPQTKLLAAVQGLTEAFEGMRDSMRKETPTPGDTLSMKKLSDLTDAEITTLATTFGVDEDDADARRSAVGEALKGATETVETEKTETTKVSTETVEAEKPAAEPVLVAALSESDVAQLRADAALGAAVHAERKVEKREASIADAIKAGRLSPANADSFRSLYDVSEEIAVKTLSELPVNADLVRVLGSDDDASDVSDEDALYRSYAEQAGFANEIELPKVVS